MDSFDFAQDAGYGDGLPAIFPREEGRLSLEQFEERLLQSKAFYLCKRLYIRFTKDVARLVRQHSGLSAPDRCGHGAAQCPFAQSAPPSSNSCRRRDTGPRELTAVHIRRVNVRIAPSDVATETGEEETEERLLILRGALATPLPARPPKLVIVMGATEAPPLTKQWVDLMRQATAAFCTDDARLVGAPDVDKSAACLSAADLVALGPVQGMVPRQRILQILAVAPFAFLAYGRTEAWTRLEQWLYDSLQYPGPSLLAQPPPKLIK